MKDQEIKDYLNSLDDDKMDRLSNSLADLLGDLTDEEINEVDEMDMTERHSFFRKKFLRYKYKKYIATRIKTSFEESLLDAMQEYKDDPLLFDLMVKATIVEKVNSFKNSIELQQLSGLEKDDYYKLVDDIIYEVMNKYFDL